MRNTYRPPFTTVINLTGLRTFDTEYQNTSGKHEFHTVTIRANITVAAGQAYVIVYCDSNPSPVTDVAYGGLDNGEIKSGYFTLPFIVPPGAYYSASDLSVNGNCTIQSWTVTR